MKKNNKLFFILLFFISSLVLILPFFFKEELRQAQSFGLFGLFLINFFSSATIFLPAPGIFSIISFADIYHPVLITFFASLGSTLGEGVGFIFGHSTREVLNIRKKHKILFHLNKFIFEKYGFIILFIIAFIPNPVVDGLGILAGMAGYPIKKFLFPVFLGRVVRNILMLMFQSFANTVILMH